MKIAEEHTSPDGLLRLLVCVDDVGDVSIGFDGYSWHIHADSLAALTGESELKAMRSFVDDILKGRTILAVSRVAGVVRDVWLTEDPAKELRHRPEEEQIEFRYWDGSLCSAESSGSRQGRENAPVGRPTTPTRPARSGSG